MNFIIDCTLFAHMHVLRYLIFILCFILCSYAMSTFQAGSLSLHVDEWQQLQGINDSVLQWIKEGVVLPFSEEPETFELHNKVFSDTDFFFIESEIKDLLKSGAIEECVTRPKCVSPMNCVPKKGGKKRLITDLRKLNSFCVSPKFKYEDVKTVISQIATDDYMISLDLKNGYQHVLVHPDSRDFLGIHWQGRYYRWRVLPFGLNYSPYVFCKIVRQVATHLRSSCSSFRACFYIDDFLLMSKAESVQQHKSLLLSTLAKLGWQVNWSKSKLAPTQAIPYIGYIITTNDQSGFPTLTIPSERIYKLKKDITRLLKRGVCSARCLARIAGQCVSMSLAILPAKLLLRNLYRLLHSKAHWEDMLTLDQATTNDLQWWVGSLTNWNGRQISTRPVDVQIETDASQTGWGAYMDGQAAAGFWDLRMSQKPSNYRELMAVMLALKSFTPSIRNKSVQILTNNIYTTAAYISNHFTPLPHYNSRF